MSNSPPLRRYRLSRISYPRRSSSRHARSSPVFPKAIRLLVMRYPGPARTQPESNAENAKNPDTITTSPRAFDLRQPLVEHADRDLGPRTRNGDAERHPRRDPFGDRHRIGFDATVLDREHPARAPHPRLHFVGDEQDAVLLRQLAQPLQELLGRHHIAAFALDWFDDDRRDFVGRHEVREQLIIDEAEALGGARLR